MSEVDYPQQNDERGYEGNGKQAPARQHDLLQATLDSSMDMIQVLP